MPLNRVGNITSGRLLGRFTTAAGVAEEITIGSGLNLSSTGARTATGGGASQWTTSGSNIYYNTGNVGIGTLTPGYLLELAGNSNPSAVVKSTGSSIAQMLVGDGSNFLGLQYYPAGNCCLACRNISYHDRLFSGKSCISYVEPNSVLYWRRRKSSIFCYRKFPVKQFNR